MKPQNEAKPNLNTHIQQTQSLTLLAWYNHSNTVACLVDISWYCCCVYVLSGLNVKSVITLEMDQTNKGNNKITELRTILQRESQNS